MKVFKVARKPKVIEQTPDARAVQKTFTKSNKQGLAKHMRENPTETEQIMFNLLTEHQVTFKTQVVMLGYIVDFYFQHAKSILEVDGLVHRSQRAYDEIRDRAFREAGFRVLRIDASWLVKDPLGVIEHVKAYLLNGRRKIRQGANIRKKKRAKAATKWQNVPKLNNDHLPIG